MNNHTIFASKTNLPFLSYFCRSQQNDSVKTGSFKRRKSKGSARPSHATPRIRRLNKQNRCFPQPYRLLYYCLAIKLCRPRKRSGMANTVNDRIKIPLKPSCFPASYCAYFIACASSDSLEPNPFESELQTYYHIWRLPYNI